MSSQKELSSTIIRIDPAHVEDANWAYEQLTPEEQEALEVTRPYLMELLRQGTSLAEIEAILSTVHPLYEQLRNHLLAIPEKPVTIE